MNDPGAVLHHQAILVRGMHGLGDSIHQRGLIRYWMDQGIDVKLEGSWVSVYHDLITRGLKVVNKQTNLRIQTENSQREIGGFHHARDVDTVKREIVTIWYQPEYVNSLGSVVAAMCFPQKIDPNVVDFRLPIPDQWDRDAVQFLRTLPTGGKPIAFYRPLIERQDWGGCAARNPDHKSFADLYTSTIRDNFYVISVADLIPGKEWAAGIDVPVDYRITNGMKQLPFELLCAVIRRCSLVYGNPGMAIPIAQSVGTPSVCVYGGFEKPGSFSLGAKFAPHLQIEPINPCGCWKHTHPCDKRIDMPKAVNALRSFVHDVALAHHSKVAA